MKQVIEIFFPHQSQTIRCVMLAFITLCMLFREMDNVNGQIRFQNHYGRVNLQLSGICNMWRSDVTTENGGLLSANVFVDIVEQKWHANLKVANVFVPVKCLVFKGCNWVEHSLNCFFLI